MIDKGCDNCYYEYFDEKAYPCSLCIRGIERTDQWQPCKKIKSDISQTLDLGNGFSATANVADTLQTEYPCETCANKGDHDGKCRNCFVDSEPIRLKTPSNYEPQTDCLIDDARFKAHCLNCAESGSYKCTKCDGEMYFKDTPQTEQTDCTWK